jgi:hypothetical protein
MYSQLIVLSEAVDGRDDEFNDWYSWVHIRDVLRLSRVVVAVQRFKRSPHQLVPNGSGKYPQEYLAIYETTDPERMTQDHKPVFTSEMPISNAYSFNNICEAYYDTIAWRGTGPDLAPKADLIVERIESWPEQPGSIDELIDHRFRDLSRLPGIVSGTLGKSGRHQMYEEGPRPELTAIYHSTDISRSLHAWNEYEADSRSGRSPLHASVDCYTPLIDRVTAIHVLEPDPESRETARLKRLAMGDKVHLGAPGFSGFK